MFSMLNEVDEYMRKDRRHMFSSELNPLEMSQEQLVVMVFDMFAIMGVVAQFQLPRELLHNLILAVRDNYRANPYHNFGHAVHVMHNTFLMLVYCDTTNVLQPLDVFALLLGSLCHDVDHRGFTNNLLVNISDELALTYNDFSVMENHHCALTFKLLRKVENNILIHLDVSLRKELRASIVAAVMATDMAVHFEVLSKVQNKQGHLNTARRSSGDRDREVGTSEGTVAGFENTREDRVLLMKVMMHAADIGHFACPWLVHKAWADRITSEFNAQVVRERELGVPVSTHLASETDHAMAKGQVGFANFIVVPLWECLCASLPEMSVLADLIKLNRQRWEKLLEYHDALAIFEEQLAAFEGSPSGRSRRSSTAEEHPPVRPVLPTFEHDESLVAMLIEQHANALPIGLHSAVRSQTRESNIAS